MVEEKTSCLIFSSGNDWMPSHGIVEQVRRGQGSKGHLVWHKRIKIGVKSFPHLPPSILTDGTITHSLGVHWSPLKCVD